MFSADIGRLRRVYERFGDETLPTLLEPLSSGDWDTLTNGFKSV